MFLRSRVILLILMLMSAASCGPSTEPRRLIIHFGAAGLSERANDLAFKALDDNIVTSAAVTAIAPAFTHFADRARSRPDEDIGLSLALNSPSKSARWKPIEHVPSLTDQEGYLWSRVDQLVNRARATEVELELRAQIRAAQNAGIRLSHLDTYKSALFQRPDFCRLYLELSIEHQLPVIIATKSHDADHDRRIAAMIARLNGISGSRCTAQHE
jgi:predicted glycoside hydrolase/deacetylase ChbG (UPF0249 family)